MMLFRYCRLLNNKNLIFLRLKNYNKNENTFHIKFISNNTVENINIKLSNG